MVRLDKHRVIKDATLIVKGDRGMKTSVIEKTCRSCLTPFVILNEDRALLKKFTVNIAGKEYPIPEPTLCPSCRERRRFLFRNETSLHRRKSSLSEKPILSIYPEGASFPVYEMNEWWSESWDPLSYGRDFDFSKPFFQQFSNLFSAVPRINLYVDNFSENCDYCNPVARSKDCYFLFSGSRNELCLYSYRLMGCRDCVDCFFCWNSELCYEGIDCDSCYNSIYLQNSFNCSDSAFLYDCYGCRSCLFCTNLQNKSYCINNIQLDQDNYEKERKSINFSCRSSLRKLWFQWLEKIRQVPKRFALLRNTENVVGDNLKNAKNCWYVFEGFNLEDMRYARFVQDSRDCMDSCFLVENSELCYESSVTGVNSYHLLFSLYCWPNIRDLIYCDSCSNGSHDCFGCVGLRGRSFCILNRQYSKNEYDGLIPKIIEHMQRTGEWGEFFPESLSPFPYNESLAYWYFPLKKEEAFALGCRWQDQNIIASIDATQDVPDDIAQVSDSVLSHIFSCEECGRDFRVAKLELRFYQRQGLPLPSRCFFCRHKSRFNNRNPRKIWKQLCACCNKELYSTVSPEGAQSVLCDECYRRQGETSSV